jgi:two-component sensor histidine kinase
MNEPKPYKGDILIVDDQPANLRILTAILAEQGYRVRPALSGELALRAAQQSPPNLILLDIRMPDMDGYEVCKRLKADKGTRDVPVIFISVLDETQDKVKAFAAGASDYMTKPLQGAEVLARVETHLALRAAQKQLEEKNAQLEREIAERVRAEEQIKATLAEKEVLLKEIHHRVKNNMNALIALIDMQTKTVDAPEVLKMLGSLQGRVAAMAMVHDKLYQSEDLAQIDLGQFLQDLTSHLYYAMGSGQPIALRVEAENGLVDVNKAVPCGLIVNELVTNALKYAFPEDREGEEDRDREICVEFEEWDDEYVLVVRDNGVGLPPELDWRTTESLGLKLVNLWTTYQLQGSLKVDTPAPSETRPELVEGAGLRSGTTFTIRFPK